MASEIWMVYKVRVDKDDYEVGSPYDKVGPFETVKDALSYIDEVHPMIVGLYRREGVPQGHAIKFRDLLSWVDSPEEGKRKAGKA